MKYEQLVEWVNEASVTSGLDVRCVHLTNDNYTQLMSDVSIRHLALATKDGTMLYGAIIKVDKNLSEQPGYFIEYAE